MPANEFEKQVQKKMGEFRLDPSASVWEKVEDEITKKKRRRILVFFLLPAALCLLGYSIYHFITPVEKSGLVKQVIPENKKDTGKEISTVNAENVRQPETTTTSLTGDNSKIQKQEPVPAQQNNLRVSIHPASGNHLHNQASNDLLKNNDRGDDKFNKGLPKKIEQDNLLAITTTDPGKSQMTKPADNAADKLANVTIDNNNVSPDNKTQQNELTAPDKNVIPGKTDSVSTVPATDTRPIARVKKDGNKKIKWGIDFTGGITANHSYLFFVNKSMDAQMAYGNPITIGGGPQATAVTPPSSIRPGPSLRFGIIGEIKLSGRSRLTAGLGYMYASNKIKTGRGLDTLLLVPASNSSTSNMQVNRVYRGSQQNDYTNSYHFVSIPVAYHWQINHSKKLPLQWDMTASFNYLLATNALIYSSSSGGIYYHDKQAINKMHVDVGTGLSLRLEGKSGKEWVLGPEISFDTRNLVNTPPDARQYLFYGGIHAAILFPQKKK